MSQLTAPHFRKGSRRSWLSFSLAILAGAALRFWMLSSFFEVSGDSQIYGGLAKNLLLHARYAVGDVGVLHPTLIRLPGYPLFLAACFKLFGMENYFPAAVVQIFIELAGCLLLASAARRISPPAYKSAASHATVWLAALCPFTAIYAAQPLTEALSVFTIALALWATARFHGNKDWTSAIAFTLAISFAALLRPDGVLVGVALAPPLLMVLFGQPSRFQARSISLASVRLALVCLLLVLAPFAAWAWRNWQVFHVIQPLAPRYATDPGEETWPGWQRWVKTWSLDFISTYQIYWNVPGDSLDIGQLPVRAFDSRAQRAETAQLADDYQANKNELSPALDARFARLAKDRIAAHPLRYYLWLPLGRMADMWVRPRVENLPIDLDWWVYAHHNQETRFSWFYAGLNALYLVLALIGLCLRPRLWFWMLLYMLLRSALLCTLEAPEARYTLECFPMIFVLGGVAIGRGFGARRAAIG